MRPVCDEMLTKCRPDHARNAIPSGCPKQPEKRKFIQRKMEPKHKKKWRFVFTNSLSEVVENVRTRLKDEACFFFFSFFLLKKKSNARQEKQIKNGEKRTATSNMY